MATLSDLQTRLGALLDVDTTRYPDATKAIHINAAINHLSNEYDTPYDEFSSTFVMLVGQESYNLENELPAAAPLFDRAIGIRYMAGLVGTALSGTWTATDGSAVLAGASGSANTEVSAGDYIYVPGDGDLNIYTVLSVGGANAITLTEEHSGGCTSKTLYLFEGSLTGDGTALEQETLEEFRADYDFSEADAQPEKYCDFGGYIKVGPAPDQIYLACIDYWCIHRDLSGSASNAWTSKQPNLVLYYAAYLAAMWLLEPDVAAMYKELAETEGMLLSLNVSQRHQSGRRPESTEP